MPPAQSSETAEGARIVPSQRSGALPAAARAENPMGTRARDTAWPEGQANRRNRPGSVPSGSALQEAKLRDLQSET